MNLAWIASVLSPFEVAPHPNLGADKEYRPEADLAEIVLGRTPTWGSPLNRALDPGAADLPVDEGVRLLHDSLYNQRTQGGPPLIQFLIDYPRDGDLARRTALTLLACALVGADDDVAMCDRLVRMALAVATDDEDSSKLCRAILLQQLAFRRRDAGLRAVDESVQAASLLEQLEFGIFDPFKLNGVTRFTSAELLVRIIDALRHASWSTSDRELFDPNGIGSIPSRREQLSSSPPTELLRIESAEHAQYTRVVDEHFSQLFDQVPRTTFGRVRPNLFFEMLRYELYGHAGVGHVRKQAAMMSAIQEFPTLGVASTADSFRLLRQAVAESELGDLVGHVEYQGPLTSLIDDARRILKNRRTFEGIRAVELRVLEAAADLLPDAEASDVLDLVLSIADEGGPKDPPGSWQVESKRYRTFAMAALAVGEASGSLGKVADRLLKSVVVERASDELWDRAYADVIGGVDWDQVPASVRNAWQRVLHKPEFSSSIATSVFDRDLPADVKDDWGTADSLSLEQCVEIVNRHVRHDSQIPVDVAARAAALSIDGVKSIRADAPNRYAQRVIDPADVMALLIVTAGRSDMWGPMLGFLADTNVPQSARRQSFDRLAFNRPDVDPTILQRHRDSLLSAIASADPFAMFDRQSGVMFPAAMRFAAVYKLIDAARTFEYVWALASADDRFNRIEAIRTLKMVSSADPPAWVAVTALQLSYDASPDVKLLAIDLLGSITRSCPPELPSASDRLRELLSEDGVKVPLAVLRSIKTYGITDERLRADAKSLRAAHISRKVRRAAASLGE